MRCFDESIILFSKRSNFNPLLNHDYVPLKQQGGVAIFLKEYEFAVRCFEEAMKSYESQQRRRPEK